MNRKQTVCVVVVCSCLLAQQPLTIEVASVKLRPKGGLITMVGGAPSGSRLALEAMSLANPDLMGLQRQVLAGGGRQGGIVTVTRKSR